MKSTALGAENIIFISDAHEKFYYEKLQEVRYQDVYHKALCYCLGINGDTRKNADRIYNFKTGSVKTKCLHEGWQTSGSDYSGTLRATCPDFESHHAGEWEPYIPVIQSHLIGLYYIYFLYTVNTHLWCEYR